MASSDDVVERVVPLVEDAGCVGPPEDVAPAVGPRHPDVFADGERDGATAAMDLLRELHPGRRRPDNQHATDWQIVGVAIRLWGHRRDSVREPGGDRWDDRHAA